MSLDREVCLCFHVSRRKLLNFIRVEKPKHPSQLSECFGAGTGCGWCRPFLKKMFEQAQAGELERLSKPSGSSDQRPENGQEPADQKIERGERSEAGPANQPSAEVGDDWSEQAAEDYAARRADYIRQGKGRPPG